MIINKEFLKDTKPCAERWKNYLHHYSEFEGSFEEFLDLDKITYDDKIWVARKALNRNQIVHWAVLCAQSVMHIYQSKYPNDNRIKDCIDYLITITDFSNLNQEQRDMLIGLRNAADAAYAYADAAADAAADAYAAANAAYAAAYAAADAYAAAYADAYAAANAYAYADAAANAAARQEQQNLNIDFLKIVSRL